MAHAPNYIMGTILYHHGTATNRNYRTIIKIPKPVSESGGAIALYQNNLSKPKVIQMHHG